jgi:phage terminase large subunit-like protein
MKNYADIAIQYAQDVLSGDVLACQLVKQACQRFMDDLNRDWEFVFSDEKANRACKFMELLPHTKGKWASRGETLVLEPWQCFAECNIFGWIHKETGLRRFRQVYEEVPRKNGKSLRLAARGLYLFCADGEAGAEVYSGATSEKQAHEIFRPAWMMAQRTELLKTRFGIDQSGNAKNPGPMYVLSDLSRFETVIGNPGDGASPHGALVDEYHEHSDDKLVDTMSTGMGAREQPLLSIITTAGSNMGGPCYEKRQECVKVLEGTVKADRLFALIYTTDIDDAWDDPQSLIKANPNYGVSVNSEFLMEELEGARRSARKQNSFRTKHLNQWVGARTAWMNMLAWQRQKRDLNIEQMGDAPCWIGVDLASKKDVAAIVCLFLYENVYKSFSFFFAPEGAADELEDYRHYSNSGHMTLTPGNMTDYGFIEEKIVDLVKAYNVQDVAFDDWQSNYLMTRVMQKGIEVVNYNQTTKNMSDPMKEVEALIIDRKFEHDGNPVMTWMMGNVACRVDAKENVYPRKDNENDPRCKIDGPVALIMAMGRALLSGREIPKTYQVFIT